MALAAFPLRTAVAVSAVLCACHATDGERVGQSRAPNRDSAMTPHVRPSAPPTSVRPGQSAASVPAALRAFCELPASTTPAAARQAAPTPPEVLRATQVLGSDESGLRVPLRCAIRTEAAWAALRDAGLNAPEGIGAQSFQGTMLLLVAAGEKPTTGHDIRVDSVLSGGDTLTAVVRSTWPTSGYAGDMFTSPVHVVRVSSTASHVVFVER